MKKIFSILGVICIPFLFLLNTSHSYATEFRFGPDNDGELVVVLDPGHGGENLGAEYEGRVEKEINMIVANAMYERLSKYEGITVYMTRTEDVDLSLLERAEFAQSVNADFLFCLHFNMSEFHTLYGAEIWIQSEGIENQEGYRFGQVWIEDMQNHGLYLRGIKTRLNSKGIDYYGILRHCKEFGITAALLEHCHLDHLADSGFANSEEDLKQFGILDADSLAKYFGLSSEELGVNYCDYPLQEIEPNKQYMKVDTTAPDMCYAQVDKCDYETGEVQISVMSYDIDTPMLYYQYSLDGGNNFSPLISWPSVDMLKEFSTDSFTFTVTIEQETSPKIIVRVHNKYNITTDSNLLGDFHVFPTRTTTVLSPEMDVKQKDSSDNVSQKQDLIIQEKEQDFASLLLKDHSSFWGFIMLVLIFVVLLFLSLLSIRLFFPNKMRRERKQAKENKNR